MKKKMLHVNCELELDLIRKNKTPFLCASLPVTYIPLPPFINAFLN